MALMSVANHLFYPLPFSKHVQTPNSKEYGIKLFIPKDLVEFMEHGSGGREGKPAHNVPLTNTTEITQYHQLTARHSIKRELLCPCKGIDVNHI